MAALEAATNFAKVTVSGGYSAAATSIALSGGHGARLPAAPFNATWWNATDYADPSDDPQVEIVRVTAKVTDTLTVTRAQESTSASTKNTVGKIYKMLAGASARLINQHFAGHHYNVKAYGLAGDGVTDDTAALQALITLVGAQGGGVIYFPKGTYLIGGPFQDTGAGGFNSQLTLPLARDNEQHITIELQGEVAPPTAFYTETTTIPTGTNFSIIKTTRVDGSGTASVLAGKKPPATTIWDNITCNVRDLIFQMPANPTYTCLNFADCIGNRIERVVIFAAVVDFLSVVEPTHSNSYGIIVPPWNHSAEVEINSVNFFGLYTAMTVGELSNINIANAWACKIGYELGHNNYPSRMGQIGAYFTQNPIRTTTVEALGRSIGPHYTIIDNLAIERGDYFGGWRVMTYDIDDPLNNLYGYVGYASVIAGIIVRDHVFKKRGGSHAKCVEIDTIATAEPEPPLFQSSEVGGVSTTIVVAAFSQSVKASDYLAGVTIRKNGVAATISSAARHTTKSEIRYTLAAPVINTDVLTFTYSAIDGFLQNEDGLHLESITTRAIVNNVGAADVIQIYDRFIDANDTRLSSHTIAPTNLPANAWVETDYAFYIQGNKAEAFGGRGLQIAVTDAETANCTIRATVKRTDYADLAICFRYQDATHFWIAELRSLDGTFKIFENNAGYVERATIVFPFEGEREYEIEVTLAGTSITAKVDGGSTISTTSASFQTATKHGIWADAIGTATFRNFWVIT